MSLRIALCILVGAAVLSGLARAGAERPVVVELYTSQGCNTCPPADAYLGTLAGRDDVVALSLHVDYWDYIGWKDPFALPGNTDRQRRYSDVFGTGYVYTPQMVVDGQGHSSSAGEVKAMIEAAAAKPGRLAVRLVEDDRGRVSVAIPADPDAPDAAVWLALFDDKHTTDIRRGENAGRMLSYYNVVRYMERIGDYDGAALTIPLTDAWDAAAAGRDGCAVIVQTEGQGPILGAAKMALGGGS